MQKWAWFERNVGVVKKFRAQFARDYVYAPPQPSTCSYAYANDKLKMTVNVQNSLVPSPLRKKRGRGLNKRPVSPVQLSLECAPI